MNSAKILRNILLACGFGGALASGCVITTGSVDCEMCNDSPLCHNQISVDPATGKEGCVCDPGYTWEDPNDATNLECERVPNKPGASNCVEPNSYQQGDQCFCDDGYIWCTDAPDDLTCCIDPAQDAAGSSDTETSGASNSGTDTDTSNSTTDTDTDTSDTGMNQPPPDSECTEDGLRACSNDNADDVTGSTAWTCLSGMWEELNLDEECQFEGSDFGYGCYDSGDPMMGVVIECGSGPGTPCTDADQACQDADLLQVCLWGKLTDVSCNEACTDPSQEITWELGECITGEARCECCDNPVDNACDCGGMSTCESDG
jgi:hypothetical protein